MRDAIALCSQSAVLCDIHRCRLLMLHCSIGLCKQAIPVLGSFGRKSLRTAMALKRKKQTTTRASTRRGTASKAKGQSKTAVKSRKTKSGPGKADKTPSPVSNRIKADQLDDLIEAAGPAFGLSIKPEWRSAVRANLHVIFGQAALFAEFELPDDAEPAPVFKA